MLDAYEMAIALWLIALIAFTLLAIVTAFEIKD